MLSKTFEWLRAVDLKPGNETVESKQRIVRELLAYFDKESDPGLLVNFVVAACAGCKNRFSATSPFIVKLVEATRKHQAAFPSDLVENALDLQITCALVVGESLVRPQKPDEAVTSAVAGVVISSLGLRTTAAGKYSVAILAELLQAAHLWLADHAKQVRLREDPEVEELDDLEAPADVAAFWEALRPQLVSVLNSINSNAQADREELEVLWWFYNRNSKLAGKPVSELSVNQAALVSAVEVANCIILPPHDGVIAMLSEALATGRKTTELNRRALKTVVADWDAPLESCLLPEEEVLGNIIADGAAAFPISWICRRLKDSGHSPSWGDEFETKSGVAATFSLSPKALVSQVFHERVAQRLLEQLLED